MTMSIDNQQRFGDPNFDHMPYGKAPQFTNPWAAPLLARKDIPRTRSPLSEPPVTKSTLGELDINKIIHNPKLRHDINFDPDLHFRPNFDGKKGRRAAEKADKFWETLRKDTHSYASSKAPSPRYNSSGYYETATYSDRINNPWPERRSKAKHPYSYRNTSQGGYEYITVDGVTYSMPASRPKKSTYEYRENSYYSRPYGRDSDDGYNAHRPRRIPPRPSEIASTKRLKEHRRQHGIPAEYSLKNWDPSEEPILLLDGVFDANSLGKWIHDFTTSNAPKPKRRFKQQQNRRKVVRIKIRDTEHQACPDSGSEENIMLEALAISLGLKIRRRPEDMKDFQLGNGKHVSSIGRVRVPVELPGNPLGRKKRWFYVFAECPVPLVLGMPFLKETEILSKNQHLLEQCPVEMGNISSLLWIGSPRQRIDCSLDGRNLMAAADTGSDLNLISLKCAKREGFVIDRRREARRRIRIGDGSETETIGQVYVYNLSLDWRKEETSLPRLNFATDDLPYSDVGEEFESSSPENGEESEAFGAIFHVLPNLPCDVIFGRDLLEQTDAFCLCPALMDSAISPSDSNLSTGEPPTFKVFHVLISLGPVALTLPIPRRKRRKIPNQDDSKERHDDARHAEMFRRSTKEDEISLLPLVEQDVARTRERRRVREWDAAHLNCIHCNPV